MKNNFDILGELREIGRMISAADEIMAVRREVANVMKEGFVVTDGKHHVAGRGYNIVVSCGEGSQTDVTRRLRSSFPEDKIEQIAKGVLGIKTARRGKL